MFIGLLGYQLSASIAQGIDWLASSRWSVSVVVNGERNKVAIQVVVNPKFAQPNLGDAAIQIVEQKLLDVVGVHESVF